MAEHQCVDCQAMAERPTRTDLSEMSTDELVAYINDNPAPERPEGGYRPLRPRAIDHRSDPPRCYSHLAAARRRGEQVYRDAALRDMQGAWQSLR